MIDIDTMTPDELRRRLREQMAENDRLRRTLGRSPDAQPVVPMVAFGNAEIEAAPMLGATHKCRRCGGMHPVEDVDPLQFIKCGETSMIVGIKGRAVR